MNADQILEAAKALPPGELRQLAWSLMDEAKIVVFVAHDLDDVSEVLKDTDMRGATYQQILESMTEASELDWSDVACQARDAIEEALAERMKRDAKMGATP